MSNNKKLKIDYLNELYERSKAMSDGPAVFGFLYFEKKNDNFVITGYNKNLCAKKIFIDGIFSEIADNAFKDNHIIEEITFGYGVKELGKESFNGCINLKKVTFRQSLRTLSIGAFRDCINLKEVYLGGKVFKIDSFCFSYCKSLESIDLGKSLKVLGEACFLGCESLKEVLNSEILTHVEKKVFKNCKTLKEIHLENVWEIGEEAFKLSNIERVYVTNKLFSVGLFAFEECNEFKQLIFKNFSMNGTFSVMTSGGNSLLSNAEWVWEYVTGERVVIERKRSFNE